MTIYLDTCALNRLTDNLSHPRVLAESDAVQEIFEAIDSGRLRWIVSDYLRLELDDISDPAKRAQSIAFLQLASEHPPTTPAIVARANVLEQDGFGALDALHLAFCEHYAVDTLITTDDRFLRRSARRPKSAIPRVLNPVDFQQGGAHDYGNPAGPDDR